VSAVVGVRVRVAAEDASFDALFAVEYPAVVRTVYLMLADHEAAIDVAQEAFVQLHLHWRKVRGYDAPGAWVRRVAIRLASRHARRRERRASAEEKFVRAGESRALDEPALSLLASGLHNAVLGLPRAQRVAVVLHYLEDMSVRDVAKTLRCSEATARVHLHRGRQHLSRVLGMEER
jgi:RNA polymerase sigma-70 factor (ECF subfamily)